MPSTPRPNFMAFSLRSSQEDGEEKSFVRLRTDESLCKYLDIGEDRASSQVWSQRAMKEKLHFALEPTTFLVPVSSEEPIIFSIIGQTPTYSALMSSGGPDLTTCDPALTLPIVSFASRPILPLISLP